LNSECWTQTNDVHGLQGIAHNFTTLAECQAECINDDTCVAIDWEPSIAGKSCWHLTLPITVPAGTVGVISHYALHRDCPSKSYYSTCTQNTHFTYSNNHLQSALCA